MVQINRCQNDDLECIAELAVILKLDDLLLALEDHIIGTITNINWCKFVNISHKYRLTRLAVSLLQFAVNKRSMIKGIFLNDMVKADLEFLMQYSVASINMEIIMLQITFQWLEAVDRANLDDNCELLALFPMDRLNKKQVEDILHQTMQPRGRLKGHKCVKDLMERAEAQDGLRHLAAAAELLNKADVVTSPAEEVTTLRTEPVCFMIDHKDGLNNISNDTSCIEEPEKREIVSNVGNNKQKLNISGSNKVSSIQRKGRKWKEDKGSVSEDIPGKIGDRRRSRRQLKIPVRLSEMHMTQPLNKERSVKTTRTESKMQTTKIELEVNTEKKPIDNDPKPAKRTRGKRAKTGMEKNQ